MQFIDRTGQRFGKLLALERAGSRVRKDKYGRPKKGGANWLVRCDCGNERVVNADSLHDNSACMNCSRRITKGGRVRGQAARTSVLNSYQSAALRKGRTWELADEEFDKITSMNCSYCGIPPNTVNRSGLYNGEFVYNGIDRVNNDLGYTLDNVVTCCHICNRAKNNMTLDEFMEWISRLTTHQAQYAGQALD